MTAFMIRHGSDALCDILKHNGEFHTSTKSFTGEKWEHAYFPGIGMMKEDEYEKLKSDHANVGIDYVIRSYDTVIAYRVGREWIVSTAKYSRTTTQHQMLAQAAIDKLERIINAA